MSGNKTDNGVLEVGTDEVRVSYSEDTPGQYVDAFIKEQEKAFHEQQKKVKKNFSSVFQNPLKGFPYNEEIIVKPLQEGTMTIPDTKKKQQALKKVLSKPLKAKDAQQAIQNYIDDDGLADKIGALPSNKDARGVITKWLNTYGPNKKKSWGSMINAEVEAEHHKSKGKPHAHEAFSKQQAKGKDIAKKMMKSKTMKAFAKKVAKMKKVSASELDKILPDYVSGGDIGALFEANLQEEMIDDFEIRFDKESDWKKADKIVQDYLKRDAPKHAIKLFKKDYVHGPDPLMVAFGDTKQKLKPPVNLNDLYNAIRKLKSSRMKYWQGIPRNKEKDAVTEQKLSEGKYLRYSDLLLKKAREMDAIDKAQDKTGVKNPSLNAIKKINKEIEKEMKKLGIKEVKQSFEEWQEAKSKMSGSKLTGAEISSYFRKNKVRDKTVRKAVEIALDHGGAMNYAIKQIEKLKRGLSKHKDVEKALSVANFGENVSEQDVEKFFGFFTENLNEETAFQTMQDIVKNKQAQKIKGVMVDMFTASVVVQAYNKVNDSNKKKIEKANLDVLVKLAHKVMGMKEEIDVNFITASLEEAPVLPSTQAGQMQGDHSIEDGVRKYEEVINKQYQSGRFAKLHKERGSKVVARKASKYYRVENNEMGKAGSIHAFIEISTGDIFKPASFKAPAKGARGNVTDQRYIDYVAKYPDAYYGGHLYK